MNTVIKIRRVINDDFDQIWEVIKQVISTGDTYVFAPDSSREKMLDYWFGADKHTFVATINGQVVGTFFIKDNQPDLGSHVANASFMTLHTATRQGIGTAMGKFSLNEAKRLGYKTMQFNLVVKSNTRAVGLWEKLGFEIVGEIPNAFNHQQNGLTNAYIMWRRL